MGNYWSNFVKTGDPNGEDDDGTLMPNWMPYIEDEPYSMIFKSSGPFLEEDIKSDYIMFMIIYIMS